MATKPKEVQLPLKLNPDASKHLVTKSKRLALAKVDFNMLHHKVWNAFLAQINPLATYPNGIEISLLRHEIAELANVDINNAHKVAKECKERFKGASFDVEWQNQETGEQEFISMGLVKFARYQNGEFLLILNDLATKELSQLTQYGSFDLKYQASISTKYGMILNDVLMVNWNKKGRKLQKIRISVDDLKRQCGLIDADGNPIKKSYAGMREFKRRVLIPGLEDISRAGDFFIDIDKIDYEKTGRTITHIVLPCTRSETVTTTLKTQSYQDRLKEHGLTDSEIEELEVLAEGSTYLIMNPFEDMAKYINDNISAVESKDQVKSFKPYMKKALNMCLAYLPDWADPFGEMYKSEPPIVKKFVELELARKFLQVGEARKSGKISAEEYADIQRKGAFSDLIYPELQEYVQKRKGID